MEEEKYVIGIVESSGGRLVIHLETGKVLNYFVDDADYTAAFASINHFNMVEWHERYPFDQNSDSFDILDLGYTNKDGKYIPPDEDYRSQSHWDHVYELKQILIDEVILHIQNDLHEVPDTDPITQLINQLPIPNLYHYLSENMTHQNRFKYLIDQGLTEFKHSHKECNDRFGLACPQCRTPIDSFDESLIDQSTRYYCDKCKVIITIQPLED